MTALNIVVGLVNVAVAIWNIRIASANSRSSDELSKMADFNLKMCRETTAISAALREENRRLRSRAAS